MSNVPVQLAKKIIETRLKEQGKQRVLFEQFALSESPTTPSPLEAISEEVERAEKSEKPEKLEQKVKPEQSPESESHDETTSDTSMMSDDYIEYIRHKIIKEESILAKIRALEQRDKTFNYILGWMLSLNVAYHIGVYIGRAYR